MKATELTPWSSEKKIQLNRTLQLYLVKESLKDKNLH